MKLINSFIAMVSFVAIVVGGFTSCKQTPTWLGNATVHTGITIATTSALRAVPEAKRVEVAKYIDVYASAVRRVADAKTPGDFVDELSKYIPENVKGKYPELEAFLNKTLRDAYTKIYEKYNGDLTVFYSNVSQLASDLEAGVSPFLVSMLDAPSNRIACAWFVEAVPDHGEAEAIKAVASQLADVTPLVTTQVTYYGH
jgi:hypothetical protein